MIEYRQLANILAMFLIVQLVGVLIAFYLITPVEVSVSSAGPSSSPQVIFYFIYIIVAAIVMILLFKTHHGALLFQLIEGFVIISASFYLFLIVLVSLLPADSPYPLPVSILFAFSLAIAKNKWPGLRNMAAVIASIGVGLVMGLYFQFFAAYALMAFIAVYDYVAVFVTKHMVTLGREVVNRNLAFMIGSYEMEMVPKGYLKKKEEDENNRLFAQTQSQTLRRLMKSGSVPMPAFSALGAGDLAIPLMLAVSAYTTYFRFLTSMVIVIGASFGLMFSMYISKKYEVALPAIPPLFSFASIALGFEFFFANPGDWSMYALLFSASIAILLLVVFTAKRQNRMGGKTKITPNLERK